MVETQLPCPRAMELVRELPPGQTPPDLAVVLTRSGGGPRWSPSNAGRRVRNRTRDRFEWCARSTSPVRQPTKREHQCTALVRQRDPVKQASGPRPNRCGKPAQSMAAAPPMPSTRAGRGPDGNTSAEVRPSRRCPSAAPSICMYVPAHAMVSGPVTLRGVFHALWVAPLTAAPPSTCNAQVPMQRDARPLAIRCCPASEVRFAASTATRLSSRGDDNMLEVMALQEELEGGLGELHLPGMQVLLAPEGLPLSPRPTFAGFGTLASRAAWADE